MRNCVIYLPVYNGERFIADSINSVLNQTYKDFDLVIYNDGSLDDSEQIISAFLNDSRIKYFHSVKNIGVGRVFHKLFKEYNDYEYIGMLGQDDVLSPNYLESQIHILENTSAIVSFSSVECIDGESNKLDHNDFLHNLINENDRYSLFLILLKQNLLCASSALINNKSLIDIDFYTSFNNNRLQDHELWLNLLTYGKFTYNERAKVYYRIHNTNLSNPKTNINENKLEYHNMVSNLLYSKNFIDFACKSDNTEKFLDCIIRELVYKIEYYGKPLAVLTINFCEIILGFGYETDFIWKALNSLYLESGLINKSFQTGPRKKMLIPIFNNVPQEKIDELLATNLFEVDKSVIPDNSVRPIYVYYLNDKSELKSINTPAIILTDVLDDEVIDNALILNDKNDYIYKIIHFIQDEIFLFNNGLFDDGQIAALNDVIEQKNEEIAHLNFELLTIYSSRGWKLLEKIRKVKSRHHK